MSKDVTPDSAVPDEPPVQGRFPPTDTSQIFHRGKKKNFIRPS